MRWVWLFSILLVLLSAMSLYLSSEYFPLGIISFEMPGSVETAWQGVMHWQPVQLQVARASLWLDFLFIVSYVGLSVYCCQCLIGKASELNANQQTYWLNWSKLLKRSVVILVLIAASFDVLENLALLESLSRALSPQTQALGEVGELMQSSYFSMVLLAKLCALVKFFLLGMALCLAIPVASGIFRIKILALKSPHKFQ